MILIVKIAVLPFLPITPDETYYFAWARHLQLSYFDHPPFVAWIMAVGQLFWKTPFGVRLPGVVLCHLGFLIWFLILKNWGFSRREMSLWMLAIAFAPLTGLGSFIITPDIPLLFFWSLALLALQLLLKRPVFLNWIFLGIVVGLGFLSKFTMAIFFLCGFILLYSRYQFAFMKRIGFWGALIATFIIFLPALIWNAQNGFASFMFQTRHGLAGTNFINLKWPLEFIGAELGLWNPVFFLLGMIYFAREGFKNRELTVMALVPFLFFWVASFRAHPEGNWPAVSAPSWFAMAVLALRSSNGRMLSVFKTGVALSVIFTTVILSHTLRPWLPLDKNSDRTFITREFAQDLQPLAKYHPLYARSYQIASYLSYFRPVDREVFKIRYMSRQDFYDYLPESIPSVARAYVVAQDIDQFPEEFAKLYDHKTIERLPSGHVLWQIDRNTEQTP